MLPRRSKSGTTTGLDRLEFPKTSLKMKEFPTGSMYEGEWDQFDMQGYGEYTFPNGVQYQGNFESGMFHGKGELVYPHDDDITVIRGRFNKGVMTERSLDFDDILDYREIDWKYCTMPDRRFAIEYVEKLKPAGQSYLTAQQPTKEIPEGFYDTGDGFFDPERKIICKYHDTSAIKRAPSTREQEWIIANCRKGSNEPIGPRPDLYESWMGPMLKTSAAPVATVALQKQPQISISRKTSVFDYDGGADDDSRPLFYNFDEFASRFPEAENERFSKAPVRY
uniref:MORN repeat-containing protein 5 n=1 Tax=Heliothis virescens TaxID=7102 RepID=A0A2A4IT82_HELVI